MSPTHRRHRPGTGTAVTPAQEATMSTGRTGSNRRTTRTALAVLAFGTALTLSGCTIPGMPGPTGAPAPEQPAALVPVAATTPTAAASRAAATTAPAATPSVAPVKA